MTIKVILVCQQFTEKGDLGCITMLKAAIFHIRDEIILFYPFGHHHYYDNYVTDDFIIIIDSRSNLFHIFFCNN